MNTPRTLRSVLAAIAFGLIAHAAAAADAENGRKLAYTCMGCHGIENYKNAYPKYSVPKLGGQNAGYLVAALGGYETRQRWHPTMQGYAATLTDSERANLGAWFASLPRTKPPAQPVGKLPESAKPCTACHGMDGIGVIEENPTLAGQHADYLAQSLNDYRLGKRENAIMGTFAKALTPADIRVLAEYYAQQPGLSTPKL